MTRQAIIYILVLLVGLAGGTGIGVFMTQSKIDEAQIALAQVKTELADLQAEHDQSSERSKSAAAEISRLKTDLVNARNEVMRKNTELLRAQTDQARMKTLLEQTLGQGAEAAIAAAPDPTPPVRTTPITPTAAATTARTAQPTATAPAATPGTREYTVKDGDSLWKIAANELGNGTRFEEILTLNPNITRTSTLSVGMKIKIPAR